MLVGSDGGREAEGVGIAEESLYAWLAPDRRVYKLFRGA